jgi:hypothetical protein
MKKLFSLIVVALFATASFAQDSKMEKKADTTTPVKGSHECYMMKDGALQHCTGDNTTAVKTDVKLKNGSTLSPQGVMTSSDGTQTKLENGQCVSLMGSVGDCEKMHGKSDMKMEEKMK